MSVKVEICSGSIHELCPHRFWQMNDQRDMHDFGINDMRVSLASKFTSGVAVVRGQNDDAVVIHSARFQSGNKFAHTVVHLVDFIRKSAIKAWAVPSAGSQIVVGKHVDIHRLGIKKDWAGFVGTLV